MASIANDPNGTKRILFYDAGRARRTIRLGNVDQRTAESIKGKIEALLQFQTLGISWDAATSAWVAGIGDRLAGKLAAVGLIPPRKAKAEPDAVPLAEFIDEYIARRTDAKKSTRVSMGQWRKRLVEHFGPDRDLRSITPYDADGFLIYLRERYSAATVSRTIRGSSQFFNAAKRKKILADNPFEGIPAPFQVDESRKHFIPLDVAAQVLDACPDSQWRLIFALSRFGGLRCPSEHAALTWADVDLAGDRFHVDSPKTGPRYVPIFPELRPHLEQAYDLAEEGELNVVPRVHDATANLRTQLLRILRRAGIEPWPKLFHNLRASRQTELEEQFPGFAVCKWLGNSQRIADKHYLMALDEHFARAAECNKADGEGSRSGADLAHSTQDAPSRMGSQVNYCEGETVDVCEAVRGADVKQWAVQDLNL